MKKLIGIAFLSLFALAQARGQSLSLPSRTPIHCSAQTDDCAFHAYPNITVVLIGRYGSTPGAITGSLGETWISDQCATFTGTCSFHATFPSSLIGSWLADKLKFSGNQFNDVFILIYDGLWQFDQGNAGSYAFQNSTLSDCTNGQDCPYAWTMPIETEAGELIIAWLDANSPDHIVRPGPAYLLEASSNLLFVEDMIASVKGVYIGSFIIRQSDGTESGGSHWLCGVAAYKRMPQS